MKLVRIPIDLVDKVWNLVQPDITESLMSSGNHTDPKFVYDTLKADKYQLWVIWNHDAKGVKEQYKGVVVTEVIQRKLKRACHIFIMTGKGRHQWQHLIKVIEDFATQANCDQMELFARPGWQKVLQNYNYKRTHVVLEKQLKKKKQENK